MKNFKKISFLSLTLSWIGLIITHIVWSNIKYNNASSGETGVIIFWASFFLLIFYGVFILFPKKYIIKFTESLNLITFTIISGIYALIGFTVLIGWGFLNSEFYGVFIDAFISGIIFGISFHSIWNKKRKNLKQKHLIPIFSLPLLFLFFYLVLFPKILPSIAFNSVPQYLRNEIIKKTIPKFKVGDNLTDLQKALPGVFNFENCKGNYGEILDNFQFVIVVNCCKIVKIEYGARNGKGITIEGKFEKPCG